MYPNDKDSKPSDQSTMSGPQNVQPNYEFIMSQNQKSKKFQKPVGKKQRIIFVGSMALLLITIGVIFMAIMGANASRGNGELIDLAAYQTELQRIVSLGSEDASSSAVKGIARTASFTLTTDLNTTNSLLNKKGVDVNPKLLTKYLSTELETKLQSAKTANTYDETYKSIYSEKLTNYQKKLAEVFPSQNNLTIQNALRNFNNHASLLKLDYAAAE